MKYKTEIQNSINYIENNLCNEINLIDIAKQSHYSEFYFHRLFHNVIGTPVMGYVRKRRLNEAAIDLIKTNEMITDIAFKYQFSSEESFSRAFKKVYSMSPRKYRNAKIEISYSENICIFNKYSKPYSNSETTFSMAAWKLSN